MIAPLTVLSADVDKIASELQAIITKATDHANTWDRSATPGHALCARELRALREKAEAAAAVVHRLQTDRTLYVPLSFDEAHVILRALADANREPSADAQARTWIAQRLLTATEAVPRG
jgi:hypothetical protein